MRRGFFMFVIAALSVSMAAQDHEKDLVEFTPDFRFNDGIFFNFEQVRANEPVSKAKILTSADYNDRDFFKKVFENDKIYYYNAMGIREEVSKEDIWGYSRNGILYIQVQGGFNRITYVGNVCHFVADITSYDRRYYGSPYNHYDPYYSPYSYNSYYSPYYMPYRPTTVSRNELVQYMIDFETGNLIEYELKNVEAILSKDPELYDEFMKLRRKKKKQMMFLYLRKYNEKHPLYLPK
ncbi:MAG: hypothetical protein ACLFN1_05170 [Bacteroidales bacterium]